ncbi:MAG: pilus assembly protein PilM [Dehalococcoidales bacterium]|nr:MAG: pilus assembly protein PilM [Dehalococcoidales bacterium]
MANQIVTIYVSDTVLRTMVSDGKQILEWAEMQLEPGLIENNSIVEEEAVAEKLKQLLGIQSVKARKVFLAINGIRCLTRPVLLPQLPQEILDEAVRREAARLLPIPLEELYLSWQTIPGPEDKTNVFLTAIPRGIVDPLMKVMDQAGLNPVFMDIKPLLLARMTEEETTILVDVQGPDFDIVAMMYGIPQPIRSIPFPGDNMSWEDKLPIIKDELDRTITFYNTNNPETPIESTVPVYLSGQLGDEVEFSRLLSEETQRKVVLIPSPIETPEGFDSSVYMANISLLQQSISSGKNEGTSLVNLNNLPAVYRPQHISTTGILKTLGVVVALAVLAAVIILIQSTSAGINNKQESLVSTNALLQTSQLEASRFNTRISELTEDIERLQAIQQDFTAALSVIEMQSIGMNSDIEVTMEKTPTSVRLTGVTHQDEILTISGIAPSEKTVLNYMLALESTGRFAGDLTADTEILEDGSMSFTLVGSLLANIVNLEVILGNLPVEITLNSVSTDTNLGTITLHGIAPDEEILLVYLNKLDSSGIFGEITISNITKLETGERDFSIVIMTGETETVGE